MSSSSGALLDPLLIARLATMELRARAVVEGLFSGRHRSRRRGRALEFSGHRQYTPSDDWRRIDWRAYARTDRWVIREEEMETNRRVLLLLDTSASMGFQSEGRLPKARYGAILLASLAYALLRQGEAVGAGVFSDRIKTFVPVRGGTAQLSLVLDLLDKEKAGGPTRLPASLEEAADGLGRRAWIVVASDLWSGGDDVLPALRRLRARHHEVSVLCPLDPLETDLSMEGDFLFKDMESGASLQASAQDIRKAYRRAARDRFERLDRALASLSIPLCPCPTDRPLDEALRRFLEKVR
jgi:uncharacterized protein (DUF58 family)